MKFIIKIFPEVMVKGDSVKKKMIRQLYFNLKTLFERNTQGVEIKRFWDKLEVYCSTEQSDSVRKILLQTPGIEQVLAVAQFPAKSLARIADIVVEQAASQIEGKRFVVRAKRTGTHEFTSNEIERYVGGRLFSLGTSAGVDLKQPEVKIELEVHQDQLNLIQARYPGLGGFPMGAQGEVLSLVSGGFDSTVASYLMMRRGLKTHFIFFNLGGAAHEMGVKQVAYYLWEQFGASHRVSFVSVPFEAVVAEIFRTSHETYMGVVLKRLMLKAAEKVADQMGIDTLVMGDAVGQVSSQTLRNMAMIDRVTEKLVLRPLSVMHKQDIMNLADQIGTREFAESMPEYCGVISQNPVINSSAKRIELETNRFDHAVLDQAVADAQIIAVDQVIENINAAEAVEVCHEVDDAVVIDIRKPQIVERMPLAIENKLVIPFYELNQKFKHLDADKRYLLYCQKGVMSQLHAQYLKDQGFNNVKVYRPH